MSESNANDISNNEKPHAPQYQTFEMNSECPKGFFQTRYLISGMLCLATFLVYSMRVNLSVSILAMTNTTSSSAKQNGTCVLEHSPYSDRGSSVAKPISRASLYEGPLYDWDEQMQALLLQSFFYGYLVSQVPAGYLAEVTSIKWTLAFSIGGTAALTCLTSVVANISFNALVVLRILEGLTEGFSFPCVFALIARWAPNSEMTVLTNVVLLGSLLGTIITLPLSAYLCQTVLGWPASFYIFGVLGLVWTVLWLILGSDTPETHRFISAKERAYILSTRTSDFENKPSVPWMKILTSRPIWVISFTKFAGTFNYYVMLTELPKYLDNMFGIDITTNGFTNAAMFSSLSVAVLITGYVSDVLIRKHPTRKTWIRKFFISCCLFVPSLCLFAISWFGCNYTAVLSILFLNCAFLGFTGGGDTAVPLDIAPLYAGAVSGLTNMLSNVAGLTAPEVVAVFTGQKNTMAAWDNAFHFIAFITLLGGLVFFFFGSAEVLPWAQKKTYLKEEYDGEANQSEA